MAFHAKQLTTCVAIALAAMLSAASAAEIDASRLQSAEQNPADWLTYHGGYKSYHYSALDQINAGNVKTLKLAWTFSTGVLRGHDRDALEIFRVLITGLEEAARKES